MYLVSIAHMESKVVDHDTIGADCIRSAITRSLARFCVDRGIMESPELDNFLEQINKGVRGIDEVCNEHGFAVKCSVIGVRIV